ncbi:unnamed protein product [Sympodiomycopsis kandeliae]
MPKWCSTTSYRVDRAALRVRCTNQETVELLDVGRIASSARPLPSSSRPRPDVLDFFPSAPTRPGQSHAQVSRILRAVPYSRGGNARTGSQASTSTLPRTLCSATPDATISTRPQPSASRTENLQQRMERSDASPKATSSTSGVSASRAMATGASTSGVSASRAMTTGARVSQQQQYRTMRSSASPTAPLLAAPLARTTPSATPVAAQPLSNSASPQGDRLHELLGCRGWGIRCHTHTGGQDDGQCDASFQAKWRARAASESLPLTPVASTSRATIPTISVATQRDRGQPWQPPSVARYALKDLDSSFAPGSFRITRGPSGHGRHPSRSNRNLVVT